MVLIEERSAYFQGFEEGNKLNLFIQYLENKSIEPPHENSEVVHKLLYALSNGVESITHLFSEQSEKKPNIHSPYIYKDLELFLFICTAKKYNLNIDWLKNFTNKRRTEDEESNRLTKTFENLLNDNLESNDGFYEFVLLYQHILGITNSDERRLNQTYFQLINMGFPFYEKPLLNIVAIKAIDLIIIYKGLDDYKEKENLKGFRSKFETRTNQISHVAFWMAFFLCLTLSLITGFKFFFGSKSESELAGKVLTYISPLAFLSCLGLLWQKNLMVNYFNLTLKKFWGFN